LLDKDIVCLEGFEPPTRGLGFHDLRLTCATLLLRQGVNPKFVQELLGHADISLTLNVYSHVLPDMGDAAAEAIDAALG
jgi:integrase